MAGIIGYGVFVPSYRIKVEEIAKVWGDSPQVISSGLLVDEKSVSGPDEDTVTISVEAARSALDRARINPQKIGAVYVGSESHPYVVKPTATIVADAVMATPIMTAADLEFACKAGTAGIQVVIGLVDSDKIEYGLAIGADTSQSAPGDVLEYTASAGGAAFIIGKEGVSNGSIADFEEFYSFTTDTPDFYRREGQFYPSHGGRFTGEPAYFKHVESAVKGIFEKTGTCAKDYDYAVFHQPNGKFYLKVGKKLGFTNDQMKDGLLAPVIGNTYSGATPLGLASILDKAQGGDKILAVSYGSGSGSDVFTIIVTDGINDKRELAPKVNEMIENKFYIDYAVYAKYSCKLRM